MSNVSSSWIGVREICEEAGLSGHSVRRYLAPYAPKRDPRAWWRWDAREKERLVEICLRARRRRYRNAFNSTALSPSPMVSGQQ